MASRIEGKRETSPISSAQVRAVIGPTPGTGSEASDSLGQQRVSLQGTDQGIFRFLQSHDAVTAHPQQRPDTLIHLFVGREQLTEVAYFVQPLLVVAHSGFHQQTR